MGSYSPEKPGGYNKGRPEPVFRFDIQLMREPCGPQRAADRHNEVPMDFFRGLFDQFVNGPGFEGDPVPQLSSVLKSLDRDLCSRDSGSRCHISQVN